jgi:aspartyl aminopeptidase
VTRTHAVTADPARLHGDNLLDFVEAAPSPAHAVAEAVTRLEKAGFRELRESEEWEPLTGGVFVARGGTLLAWYTPPDAPAHLPYLVVEAHTDSPHLRIRAVPDTGSAGWRQLGVEPRGDVPLHQWCDRDLGVSGRLFLRDGTSRLVCLDEPLVRVPAGAPDADAVWGLGGTQPGALLTRLSEDGCVDYYDVLGWDLLLHDVQPPGYLGARREFLVSARLDDLVGVHAGLTLLTGAPARTPTRIPVLAAFDHQETDGVAGTARAALLERTLRRAVASRGGGADDWGRALAGSFGVRVDMTHAVHPNDPDGHHPDHRPLPNGGPAVRVDAGPGQVEPGGGLAAVAALCERSGTPWQTSLGSGRGRCGADGPSAAALLGLAGVDLAVPGLSVHSPRELCGADDPWLLARLLQECTSLPTAGLNGRGDNRW